MPPRLRRAALPASCAVLLSVLPLASAAQAAPSYTMEERASAIAAPAVLFIESRTEGYLRLKATGQMLHEKPITVSHRCSGFVVSGDGHVVTATRCVQPSVEGLRSSASYTLANSLIREKKLAAEQKDAYIAGLATTVEFTARDGASMDTKIYGQLFQAWGGVTTEPALPGQLMQSLSAAGGDLSMVKFAHQGMPVVEIGGTAMEAGQPVVAIGFGTGPDAVPETANYTLRTRAVRVTEQIKEKSPAQYRLDGDVGVFSHGGVVVDESGRAVGVITADPGAKDRANQAAIDVAVIKDMLAAASARNALSERDQAYRSGLDAYFAGRYTEAIGTLDRVVKEVPSHSIAANYRRQAAQRLAVEGEPDDGLPLWAVILITALVSVLLTLTAVLVVLAVMRRRRPKPDLLGYELPISAIPISATPISGTPISGTGYAGRIYDNPWAPAAQSESEKRD